MLKDIQFIQNREMLCEEAIYATVAVYWKRHYEMMFSHMWNFSLKDEKGLNEGIGKIIEVDNSDILDVLERYHGIKVEKRVIRKTEKLTKVIKRLLDLNSPVAMDVRGEIFGDERTNGFFFPVLVIGIDEENIYCIDVHLKKEKIVIPIGLFIENCSLEYEFFLKNDVKEYGIDWREIISFNTKRWIQNDSFRSMKRLSSLFYTEFDLMREKQLVSSDNEIELCENIKMLYRTRFLYTQSLIFLNKYCGAHIPDSICSKFIDIYNVWLSIWGRLVKAFIKMDVFPLDVMSKKISQLADDENLICQQLVDVCNGWEKYDTKKYDEIKVESSKKIENKKVLYLDLSSYFNNEGFSSSMDTDSTADLTGFQQFLITENWQERNIWEVGNLSFVFNQPQNGCYDNISCSGEEIIVTEASYSSILFIGCAEWGNQVEKLGIQYAEEKCEIPFCFSDLSFETPAFDEQVIWEGKCVERKDGRIICNPWVAKAHLFAKSVKVDSKKTMLSIQLPNCNNIHIFAISMYR